MFCPKCGKAMLERENDYYCMRDDVRIDKKTGKQVTTEDLFLEGHPGLKRLKENLRQKLVKHFQALYIDGYAYLEVDESYIYIFEDSLRISIGALEPAFDFNIGYDAISVLQVTQEREITALRTYVLGPALAALFKKRTLVLNIGFNDSLGLLQVPSFKMARNDLDECYDLIIERIAKAKGKELEYVRDRGGEHYPDLRFPSL